MADQYAVTVALIVKADSADSAQSMVRDRVSVPLNEWFNADLGVPTPVPAGSLLWWGTHPARQVTNFVSASALEGVSNAS